MATPLWRDYYVTLGTAAVYDFRVYDSDTNAGNIIYQGRAYNQGTAGTDNVKVRVNDICLPWFSRTFPLMTYNLIVTAENIRNKFSLYVSPYANPTNKIADWSFYDCWSYEDWGNEDYTDIFVNCPILHRYQRNQPIIVTNLKNGTNTLTAAKISTGGAFSNIDVEFSQPSNCVILPDTYTNIKKIQQVALDGDETWETFNIVQNCHKFALYYVNAFGGWDTLLIEGKAVECQNFSREEMSRSYNNVGATKYRSFERGRQNTKIAVVRTWELHTGWLTDKEASRMHHLLGSTNVYVVDLEKGKDGVYPAETYPVIITNADCPKKTYKNQDLSLVSYEINCEYSHYMARR